MTPELLIGIGASTFTAIASVPQLLKLIKEKKADNISTLMYGVLLTGLVLWIIYGIFKEDWILIISNAFSLLINSTVLILALVYKE